MQTFHDIASLQQQLGHWRRAGERIALVPTMGNLHRGHLALVDSARHHADRVVATIFVNPLQFGPDEDFERYPRSFDEDCRQLEAAGCDLLFAPAAETLYPNGQSELTRIHVPGVSEGLCGAHRPGHFDGVATVVSLLFHITQPDVACFGEKDFQQLAVIRKLVRDQHFPIDIIGVPTVRDHDMLALSSRNAYLDSQQRARAARLPQLLKQMSERLGAGETIETVLHEGEQILREAGFTPEYLELRNALTLAPAEQASDDAVLLVAARLGQTRLIDNRRLASDS
ncbi:pantoate--beta-alanine ligase [Kushneria phosphatilytica]|uniref:Pantothenate synthetase n=1 Tax=Kushneria phosphatilytica TaxID=657387 RepID=A0A1S1NVV6_9GAMM|nr:pantoate--beta-alanine ligase [Kushneria phosphatilytica]OHV11242.1 pantoate--beta-alanine ligase [Kushneria phosphatilytica]QEL12182.1 pantoate--beta-alanine ligase [Kushneria phosphatilytica]